MKLNAEQVASQLFDYLWNDYSEKVLYVSDYLRLLQQHGGKFVADHVVFRTVNTHTGEQPGGIEAISHLLSYFGYRFSEKHVCKDKMITISGFDYPGDRLPKVLVSQLEVNHQPGWIQHHVGNIVAETPYTLSDKGIELLNILKSNGVLPIEAARFLLSDLQGYFCRPWEIPEQPVIEQIMEFSPYCAWVLLYGNSVSRFSANINLQGVPGWANIDKTIEALQAEGVPFQKHAIAGETKFVQAFAPPVKLKTEVLGDDGIEMSLFEYSKFGLTERGFVDDNGGKTLFDGFLLGEGTHFYEMV
ncbi:MAG: hypothetical protein AB7S72_02640 [Draconibacterium sp.]